MHDSLDPYVPSANVAVPDANPDRLAAVATLFGLSPASPANCRVLEVGCAEGVHLTALAANDRESTFVGADPEERAIEHGRERARLLELSNLELRVAGLESLLETGDRFDYVVAHGVYSWIPTEARSALLRVLSRVLNEHGVAFLSFNALPGGYGRGMLRELLLPQVSGIADPRARIAKSREVARALARTAGKHGASELLRGELEHFARVSDSLVHHDYLAETNHAETLGEFVRRLAAHDLDYLTDAETLDLSPLGEHPLLAALAERPHVERLEYLDRLELRRFRQAVVCRRGATSGGRDWSNAGGLWALSSAEPIGKGSASGAGPAKFRTLAGLELETTSPEIKVALGELGAAWPEAIELDELAERVARTAGGEHTGATLAARLFESGAGPAIRLVARPPRATRLVSERPLATPFARLEVAAGGRVTNLHHTPVTVEPEFTRRLLAFLDGTRDRAGLAGLLSDQITKGSFEVAGLDPQQRARWEPMMEREVEAALSRLARFCLILRH